MLRGGNNGKGFELSLEEIPAVASEVLVPLLLFLQLFERVASEYKRGKGT